MRTLLRAGLRRLGLHVTRYPPPHLLASHLRRFLHTAGINLVLDVGAYHGGYCRLLREEAGYTGAVVSFEPCRASFETLRARLSGDPAWRGFHCGLSDREGAAELHTYGARGDFNSVLPLDRGGARLYDVNTTAAASETVQLRRLDAMWEDLVAGIPTPRVFLKMDTQGHDLAVVEGAGRCLSAVVGLQSELAAIEIYVGMPSMASQLASYRAHGFVPAGFYPVNTPPALGVPLEFDVVFARHPHP